MTLATWKMAQKWKPRLQSRRFAIVGSSVLQGVSTDIAVGTSIECRPRCQSICQPTIGWPIYSRHSTAAVYGPTDCRSMLGCYTADITDGAPTHHWRIIDSCLTRSRLFPRLLPVLNVWRLFTVEVSLFSEVSTWRYDFLKPFRFVFSSFSGEYLNSSSL